MTNLTRPQTEIKPEQYRTIALCVPESLVHAIDRAAGAELLNRSTWLRRTVLNAVERGKGNRG